MARPHHPAKAVGCLKSTMVDDEGTKMMEVDGRQERTGEASSIWSQNQIQFNFQSIVRGDTCLVYTRDRGTHAK